MDKKIKRVTFAYLSPTDECDGPIEEFMVNGEMAPVRWFRQGNNEYNGKYVTSIEYEV